MTTDLSLALDLSGVGIVALSGALLAVRKGFDVVGVTALALAAGLGGGMIRDVLLGALPPRALTHATYLLAALAAALFHPALARLDTGVRLLDAVGLGLFAVSGAAASLDAGLSPLPAILLGVVSGVGGGVVRDVLALETPLVLHRDIYALAALLGAGTFVGATRAGLPTPETSLIAIAATIALRVLAIHFGWRAPTAGWRPTTRPD